MHLLILHLDYKYKKSECRWYILTLIVLHLYYKYQKKKKNCLGVASLSLLILQCNVLSDEQQLYTRRYLSNLHVLKKNIYTLTSSHISHRIPT